MDIPRFLTTREVAERMRITSSTVHQRRCVHGDFWGVLPVRAANGRLLWPVDAIEALLEQRQPRQKA